MHSIPLGLASVAASARQAGHTVRMLDLLYAPDVKSALADAIDGFRPEAIGISIRNIDDQNMAAPRFLVEEDRRVVEQIKMLSEVPIILGGAGYSIFPEAALDYTGAEMGIQGEGEDAFCRLLQRLEGGQSLAGVPGLYVRGKGLQGTRAFVKSLDQFPLPSPDLLCLSRRASDTWVPVQTRRGCPMNCSYCSTTTIEGTMLRRRSVDRVVEWITQLRSGGVRQFYFVDNTFNLPPAYAGELCDALIRASLDLSWRCIVYPRKMDEKLAAAMAAAGCVEASVGFETGCERLMAVMNKRFRREEVRQTSTLLRKNGIHVMGFLLLGGPGETRESVEESIAFADSLCLDSLKVTIGVRIYPYTALAEQARKEAVIAPDDNLLFPKFYMAAGLEEWIRETVTAYGQKRPHWIVDT